MLNLGDKVKDAVSGLVGIVVVKSEYLNSCVRFAVQPQEIKDGKPVEASWFDEPQLILLKKMAVREKQVNKSKGGAAYLVEKKEFPKR